MKSSDPQEELIVVPTERHIERLAHEGRRAETRASLRARLATALLPNVRFVDPRECHLTLAMALEEARARSSGAPAAGRVGGAGGAGQLSLFGFGGTSLPKKGSDGVSADETDPLLATLRGRGGASWVRAVRAIDEAIGGLRLRGVTETHLERVRGHGVFAARARTLAAAMRALDDALARSETTGERAHAAGARDGRLLGSSLAAAIRESSPAAITSILGARSLRARWLLSWDPLDLAWWRALDEMLERAGGHARVVLPAFDKRLSSARDQDPLEIIADIVARHLDAAPETELIDAVLGDLAATPATTSSVTGRVRLAYVKDAREQAKTCARTVVAALAAREARVERVVIAYATRNENTLRPLRRALWDEGVVFHDALGPPPTTVPVIAAALHALSAAESRSRMDVARVLRCGYLDLPGVDDVMLATIATRLEQRATAAGDTPSERLLATILEQRYPSPRRKQANAGSQGDDDGEAAERELRRAAEHIVDIFTRASEAKTRHEHARAARTLFVELGFSSRVGQGALSTFRSDDAPTGIDRAERLAIARDVRAWETLEDILSTYEATARRSAEVKSLLKDMAVDAEVFRLELADLLDASSRVPSASRAGAVRLARLADVGGDELDLLIVLDANDGTLPRDLEPITLVSETLEGAVAKSASREGVAITRGAELSARDLAALAMTAAESRQIVFMTTADDGSEAPARPSRIVSMLERAGSKRLEVVPADVHAFASAGTSPLRSAQEIARRTQRERAREGFFLDPERPLSPIVGTLEPSATIRAIVARETGDRREHALAVTSVERFAQCPFKGYAHVVLAAREGEEQQELPDAREEGNLGHNALAAAFVAARAEWPKRPRDAEAIMAKGLAAAEVVLAQTSGGHAALRAIVRLRIRESVRAVLTRAIADETWDFAFAEQGFGVHRPWEPFRVQLDASEDHDEVADRDELWLRGSIDRVDRRHDKLAARVVDYKRSKSTARDSSAGALGVTALQIPVYAVVAAQALGVPTTGVYLPMQPRDLATERLTPPSARANNPEERVANLARRPSAFVPSEIERRVLDIASSARDGHFAPFPARESECAYCSASGGCRKPRFAMAPMDDADDQTPAYAKDPAP